MRRLLLAGVLALAVAAPAAGGGYATVQLSSLPQGATWSGELTVKAHGVTPVGGLSPVVRIRGEDGTVREFAAAPAGETGVYRFAVAFPSAGTWTYEIDDGYSQTHTYAPVTIAAPAGDAGFPWSVTAAAATLAAGALALTVLLRRRTRPRSAGAPALR